MVETARQNEGLHLVRGLCAIGVVAYHYVSWEHGVEVASAGSFLVYIFFTLSALTLMKVHGAEFASGIKYTALVDFYRKRVARILPLLAATAALSVIWNGVSTGSWDLGGFLRAFLTGTALFGLQMPGYMSNVVAAWSLGIEAVFYLLFPLVAMLAINAKLRSVVIAAALLVIGQHCVLLLLRGADSTDFWYRYANPLVFTPFFALGVLIYLRPIKTHRRVYLWISVCALAAVAGFSLVVPVDVYRNSPSYLFLTALAGFVVLTSYSASVPRRFVIVGRFLGNISYALYLTHWFSFDISDRLVRVLGLEQWQIVIFPVLALAVSQLVFKAYEMPMRNLLRGDRPRAPLITAVP